MKGKKLLATVILTSLLFSGQTVTAETTPLKKTTKTNTFQLKEKENKQAQLLQSTKTLAKQGKIINAEYAVETSLFDDIEKIWGKPDQTEYVNGLTYATYKTKKIVLGFNKGMQVVEIRTYDPVFKEIPLSKVVQTLGKPNAQYKVANELIYVYKVNEKYELKFIFPAPTKQKPDPHIDHVNILYPRGKVNLMSQ